MQNITHIPSACQEKKRAQYVLDPARQFVLFGGRPEPLSVLVGGEVPAAEPPASAVDAELFPRHRHHQRSFEFIKDSLARCHNEMRAWTCEKCEKKYVTEYVCNLRICPDCARARAMKYAHRYGDLAFRWPLHLVMGLPVTTDLGGAIALIIHAVSVWRKLYNASVKRQRRGIKRAAKAGASKAKILAWFGPRVLEPVRFGVYSTEILRSGGGWFVHAHQLVECSWLDKDLAEACWREATAGAAWIVKIRRVSAVRESVKGAIFEVCKYVTKHLAGAQGVSGADLELIYRATFNRRLVGGWGLNSRVHTNEIKIPFLCGCGGRLLPSGERITFAETFRGLLDGTIAVLHRGSGPGPPGPVASPPIPSLIANS